MIGEILGLNFIVLWYRVLGIVIRSIFGGLFSFFDQGSVGA